MESTYRVGRPLYIERNALIREETQKWIFPGKHKGHYDVSPTICILLDASEDERVQTAAT